MAGRVHFDCLRRCFRFLSPPRQRAKSSATLVLDRERPAYLGLGALFPAAIACIWSLCRFLNNRILWSFHELGGSWPPSITSYFVAPSVLAVWLLPGALAEEVAWRVYLQPRFIQRHGLMRGIFLVGIVWGAFYFSTDFGGYSTLTHITFQFFHPSPSR